MVAGVIRLTALLFNHDTLRAAIASWDLRMHIVFSIVAEGKLAFPIERWRALVDSARAGGFKAGDHSAGYEAAYRPAYRVVAGGLVP